MTNKSWRDQIKVHPAADLFPMMTPDELKALGEDIKKNGLTSPIAVAVRARSYSLLDGRNRLDAMELVGINFKLKLSQGTCNIELSAFDASLPPLAFMKNTAARMFADSEAYDYVVSVNIQRRHLTADQKRDLIAKVLKAQPEKSNRQLAKMVGVSHPHLAKVRHELETSGDVETVTTSLDTMGRRQQARKPSNTKRDVPPARDGTAVLFGDRPMSKTAAKKLEQQNAELATKALHEQVGVFFHELTTFIHDNYCPRLTAWVEAHPEVDDEGKAGLVNVLESCSMTLQQLAQKIDGRDYHDNDEAAKAPAAPPVGDEIAP